MVAWLQMGIGKTLIKIIRSTRCNSSTSIVLQISRRSDMTSLEALEALKQLVVMKKAPDQNETPV